MRGPFLQLLSGAFSLAISVQNLTANKTLKIDGWTAGQIPRISTTDPTILEWVNASVLGGGTVTSVGLGANASGLFSVATPTSTPVLSLQSQPANTVLAAPDGAAGAPVARILVAGDIPSLDASKIATGAIAIARLPVGTAANTVAAGNDGRFHTQNSDTGTSAASFQIATGATGPRLKNASGSLEIRNAADTAYADLTVNNIYVRGTQVVIDSNQVNIGDSILTLNADYSGSAPTENGGFEVQRGTQTNASLVWNESNDWFAAGLAGAELRLCRNKEFTFTSTALSGGVLVVSHGLANQYPHWVVADNSNNNVLPQAIYTDSNTLTLDFGQATVTGTWRVVLQG